MSETKIRRIHAVYSAILSILAAIVAILLAVSCVDIYKSGTQPFSPESISSHFKAICIPFYIFIVAIFGGFVLNTALPAEPKKLKGGIQPESTLKKISSRFDESAAPAETLASVKKEQRIRLALKIADTVLFAVGALLSFVYILNRDNFASADFNSDIAAGAVAILIFLLPSFALSVTMCFVNPSSIKREISLIKSALATQKPKQENKTETENIITRLSALYEKNERTIITALRVGIFALGLLFVGLGIPNGGASDVVQKAIKICTEGIGLG